ncbi:MAG TPA: DUF5694 domain-containing protein [Thermoanaerobaculia bacterium]|nr:DUF5694 domain-containing protein [Thermoanaerobaculia bacterium]
MRTLLLALALSASLHVTAQPTDGCAPGKRPLLILGTFHMKPSGQDSVNRDVVMDTPQRQAQVAELVDQLAQFRPTKIAIESARNSTVWNDRYAEWRKGTYTVGMNEIEQIGFRLAKQRELDALTPVDYPMWMDGLTPIDRHEPKKKKTATTAPSPEPDAAESALINAVQKQIAKDDQHLATHTLAQHLAYLNEPSRAAMNHQWDVMSNLRPGDGVALYEQTDLVTNWYKRNFRIFTNILDATTPSDRIVLLIGAGHVKILSDLAADHPDVCLVPVSRYLH